MTLALTNFAILRTLFDNKPTNQLGRHDLRCNFTGCLLKEHIATFVASARIIIVNRKCPRGQCHVV